MRGFDWEREWFEGETPAGSRLDLREMVRKYPGTTMLVILLAVGVLVMVGVA